MNILFRLLIGPLAVGLLLSATSCKKDPNPVGPDPTGGFAPSFEGVHWQIANIILDPAIDINGDGKPDSDITELILRPCDLDNSLMFEHGGKFKSSNGKLSCEDDDPTPAQPGTWTYNSDTKKLRIVDGEDPADTMEWSVIEASPKYLKVKTSLTEEGQTFGIVMIWKTA